MTPARAQDRRSVQIVAARVALTLGSIAGLGWLAPLEWSTGVWLGLDGADKWQAIVVPLLIDSYVVLSVLTERDRKWALPIAGVSGLVGQLHVAGVLEEGDKTTRGVIAALAALIAVAVTARLKPLVSDVITSVRSEWAAEDAARQAHELAAQHAARLEEEAAHQRAQEAHETAHRRDMERIEKEAALAHARATPQPARPTRTVRTPSRARARKATARAAQNADDLQLRSRVRAQFEESVRTGTPMDNATLARALFSVTDADPKQLRAAAAAASRWRRAVDQPTEAAQ